MEQVEVESTTRVMRPWVESWEDGDLTTSPVLLHVAVMNPPVHGQCVAPSPSIRAELLHHWGNLLEEMLL